MKLKIFLNLFFSLFLLAISFFIVFIYTNYQEFREKSTSIKYKPTVFNKDGNVNYNNLPLFNNNKPIYDLTIVFPAYKEKNRLPNTLKNILNYLKTLKIKFEIIIVNDGSPDDTLEIIKSNIKKYKEFPITGITYEKNAGKGFAVKTGISYARGKYILMMDADDAFDHNDIYDLYQMIKGKNNMFLVGSRKINIK
jgi:cellulose synthase/poly-beta-1,6-N-acetylglucosamine synthase-like glycosyltransferase